MRSIMLRLTAAAALLAAGLVPGLAQDPATEDTGFHFTVAELVLGLESVDSDTNSAKLTEYRDLDDGGLGWLRVAGEGDGDRYLWLAADRIGREDGRYNLAYGTFGDYALELDYNQIVHDFANDGRLLYARTGAGRYEISDATQSALQSAIVANQSRLNFAFLNGLITPYINAAPRIDVGLQRDRLRARFGDGRMSTFGWSAEYRREERDGTRQWGGGFGFNNVTELPEPTEYTTQDAEVAGEWNGKAGGLRFGYRLSTFANDVSTLVWDNPWRITDSSDAGAYQAPGTGSVAGAVLGFADLAPDNEAGTLFVNGRGRTAGWTFGGSAAYINMTQDERLLPYTLNSAIVGIDFDHTTFNPTDPANLPLRNADTEVDVLSLSADAARDFGERFDLALRYRYYDYDNQSPRVRLPGYVRYHGVWEDIPRITVPYAYTREDLSAELGWDVGARSHLALMYKLAGVEREFLEVSDSDEDVLRLSFDTRASQRLTLRARYERGDRGIGHYDLEETEASFLDPAGVTVPHEWRRFDQAAREYDEYNLQSQWTVGEAWNLTLNATGRQDSYDESELGLQDSTVHDVGIEVGYAPGEKLNVYAFANVTGRSSLLISRQSGSTPSVRPIDNWKADFEEDNLNLGAGLTFVPAERFTVDLSARRNDADGEIDFTAFSGGLPVTPPRPIVDIPNYEDVELTSVLAKVGYRFNERLDARLGYLWEDYTIDSFISQALDFYLPGALLINGNNYDYQADVLWLSLGLKF